MFLLMLLILFASHAQSAIQFEDISAGSGLFPSLQGMMGHAAAWGDIDGDGLPDLFVGGFCDRPAAEYAPAKGPVPTRLFRNLGNGHFQLLQNSPVALYGRTAGAVFADLNRDGFPELYVANNAKGDKSPAQKVQSKLFQNNKGNFVDVSSASGACPQNLLTARSIGVLDYNGDGLLDLFVVEDRFKKNGQPHSVLLKNTGNMKFQVANTEAGLPDDIYGLGLAVADLNEDGKPDFFVAHSNRLFLSQSGHRFHEATELRQTFHWNELDNEDWPSGAAFGDLNRDGDLDLVITIHHDPARNKVFLNRGLKNGVPIFEDVTTKIGLAESIPAKCPHVEIQDFDNDGWPDIYTTAASVHGSTVIPLIYRNEGIGTDGLPHFNAVRPVSGPMIYFPGGPTADFDNDGKLDIFLVNWFAGQSSHLLKNRTAGGNWFQVKAPIGTKIKLFSGEKLIGYQQVYVAQGFASGELPICHFGTGQLRSVDLQVTFPDGTQQKRNAVVNRRIDITK
jgi:hypothetical protein